MRILQRLFLTLSILLSGCRGRSGHIAVSEFASQLPADGREHRIAMLRGADTQKLRIIGVPASSTRLDESPSAAVTLFLRAPVQPATTTLTMTDGKNRLRLPITFATDNVSTVDGTPDWMRLHAQSDRQAFRRWFTVIADRAADTPPAKLPAEITDCASLIRYAYREALRLHDDRWYAQFPADSVPALTSVQQWAYPNTPLGPNLFRTRPGPFQPDDLTNGTFREFADAKTLHSTNAYLLGRDLRLARPGDLIFYRVLETDSQYHSMIITGEHGEWVVYNTGPDHGHHGEMRRVLLVDLLHHPDPRWRPEPANPNWLGVYRWNILRED